MHLTEPSGLKHLKPLSNAEYFWRWPWSWTSWGVTSSTITVASRNTEACGRTTWKWRTNPASDHPCPPLNPSPSKFPQWWIHVQSDTRDISDLVSNMCVAPNTLCKFHSIISRVSHRDVPYSNSGSWRKLLFLPSQKPLGILLGIYKYISIHTYIFLVQHDWLVTVRKAISVKGLSVWSAGIQEDAAHIQKWNTWKKEGWKQERQSERRRRWSVTELNRNVGAEAGWTWRRWRCAWREEDGGTEGGMFSGWQFEGLRRSDGSKRRWGGVRGWGVERRATA